MEQYHVLQVCQQTNKDDVSKNTEPSVAIMPEKHLFVNSSHYRDRPDPNMRYKIASHAAKYGPSGTLASKTPFNGPDEIPSESTLRFENRASSATPQSTASSPRVRPAALVLVTSWDDVLLRQDYDYLSARLSDFCICSDNAPRSSPSGSKGKMTHAEDCSILDDHLAVLQEQELPFRVAGRYQQSANNSFSPPAAGDLILQCSLVAGQAAIDGLNPDFENKPSSPTLQLQQKALKAMRRAITARNNVIDDSIVVASAIMLSVAVRVYHDLVCELVLTSTRHFMLIKMPIEPTIPAFRDL